MTNVVQRRGGSLQYGGHLLKLTKADIKVGRMDCGHPCPKHSNNWGRILMR